MDNPFKWEFLQEPAYRWILWVGLLVFSLIAWNMVLRSFR